MPASARTTTRPRSSAHARRQQSVSSSSSLRRPTKGVSIGTRSRRCAEVVAASGDHEMGVFRVVDALQRRLRLEAAELEGVGDEAARRLGGQHGAGRRRLLQSRGQVDREPDRLAGVDGDEARRNADADGDGEIRDGADDLQPRLDSAHRRVLERMWVAEVAHDAVVALRIVGLAAMAAHDVGAARVQAVEHLCIRFVAESSQQRGGADEVEG